MNLLPDLNRRFPVPGLRFEAGPGGLVQAVIQTPSAKARLALHGAHLMEWTPANSSPVLWMSGRSQLEARKPIRGGVPICWPWFGAHADANLPMHGFARLSNWTVESASRGADGVVHLALFLDPKDVPPAGWPHAWGLRYEIEVGPDLILRRTTRNTGGEPFSFTAALHTYFTVGDVRQVRLHGFENHGFLDRLTGLRHVETAPVQFAGETDRIYPTHSGAAEIEDPALKRRIRIEKRGSGSSVVWNPHVQKARSLPDFGDDEWPSMLCVEAANVLEDAVTLGAGEAHVLEVRIQVS
ncbi:MAG: D-hexose-6-phosphate mutarotase [Spirochaetes bacterium]|nr:D-hexose-6-phosphate mutarotase [Spirochaetota bacterium]